MITKLHEVFKHIVFFEKDHLYINKHTGEKLPSVTGHIKKFQPEFNEAYWLEIKAAQRGIKPEELKKEWKQISKLAVEMGSALHSYLEQAIQRRYIEPYLPEYLDKNKFELLKNQANQYVEELNLPVVACEFVMCNKEDSLAGMCDCLLEGSEGLIIRDYKTGQLKRAYGTHKEPYSFLSDSSLDKYSLQLNHYRMFLEDRGFPVEKMEIVWFNENNPTYEIHEIKRIEII